MCCAGSRPAPGRSCNLQGLTRARMRLRLLHNRTGFLHNGWAGRGAAGGQRETEPQKRLSAEGRSKRRKLEPGVTAARPNKLT